MVVRIVVWTLASRWRAWRHVRRVGMTIPRLPAAPHAGLGYTACVSALLRFSRGTCLVRSLVLQRWYADHGEACDVVIGVTAPSAGFKAHAWLDRPEVRWPRGYHEFCRIPARVS